MTPAPLCVRARNYADMSRSVSTDAAPAAVGPYSQATIANGFVFTAGQIALTAAGDDHTDRSVKAQTKQCLTNVEHVLEAAGAGMDDVVKTTVFLADIDDYSAVNEVYAEYFGENPPARSAVAVADLPKGADVEIETVATIA